LAIFNDLEAQRIGRVLVTRRGRPVAEQLDAATHDAADTLGRAPRLGRGRARGVDLTAPVL